MDKIGLQLHINENDKIILTDSKNRKNENRKNLMFHIKWCPMTEIDCGALAGALGSADISKTVG